MSLELDKAGVPTYKGEPEYFDEWCERARDLWFTRAGQPAYQSSTALALRGGLRGTAYEAARKATHEDLRTELKAGEPSIDGVEYLIECVNGGVAAGETSTSGRDVRHGLLR